MQVAKHKVVTIDYQLKDDEGNVLEESQNGEFSYLHGAENIMPTLEEALDEKSPGEEVSVAIPPEQAYGERDEALSQTVTRDMFPSEESIEVGRQFHAQSPDGQPLVVSITGVEGDDVTVDVNHPLAGKTLNFDVKVVDVREASEEEVSHGHVHGASGAH